jgi:hypothetical protein
VPTGRLERGKRLRGFWVWLGRAPVNLAWKRTRTRVSSVVSLTSTPWGWRTHGRSAADEAKPAGRWRAFSRLARTAGARETGVPVGTCVARNASSPPGVANSTLRRWRQCGRLDARWHPESKRWVARVDEAGLERLKQQCVLPAGQENSQIWLESQTSPPTALFHFTNA